MKNLIIIGARGFGREVYWHAQQSRGYSKEFKIKGFLDDKSGDFSLDENYPPVLSSVEAYEPLPDDRFICALGNVKDKITYSKKMLKKGVEFISLVSKKSKILSSTTIGKGCIIMGDVRISTNVQISDFSTIMVKSVIGHDAIIGKWTHIGPFSFIGGGTVINNEAQIHVRSTILAGLDIGKRAVTGAGSVVIKNVEPGVTVFGNPAKVIGKFNK